MTQVLVQTTGWNPETQADGPLDSILVSVMVLVSGHEGKWLTKECTHPNDLWVYLQALDRDKKATLAWNFNYHGPIEAARRPTLSVDKMLQELEAL